jgi:hypothetical protein
MAKLVAYVDELVQEVGPRPAGTQQEHQAAELIASRLDEFGLNVEIAEFPCARNIGWVRVLYYGLCAAGAAVMVFSSGLLVVGAVAIFVGTLLMILDHLGKNPLFSLINTSLSQNVIARYEPEGIDSSSRSKKIVVLAHYDSSKTMVQAAPLLVKHYSLLRAVVRYATIALTVCAILLLVLLVMPVPPIVITIASYVVGVLSLAPLLSFVVEIINFFMPYNQGANCNGSGVGVLYGLAQVLTTGSDLFGGQSSTRRDGTRRRSPGRRGSGRAGRAERAERGGRAERGAREDRMDRDARGVSGRMDLEDRDISGRMDHDDLAGNDSRSRRPRDGRTDRASRGGRRDYEDAGFEGAASNASDGLMDGVMTAAGTVAGVSSHAALEAAAAVGASVGAAAESLASTTKGIADHLAPGTHDPNETLAELQGKPSFGAVANDLSSPFITKRSPGPADQNTQGAQGASDPRGRAQVSRGGLDVEADKSLAGKPAWFVKAKQNAEKKLAAADNKTDVDESDIVRSQFADVPVSGRAETTESQEEQIVVERSQFAEPELPAKEPVETIAPERPSQEAPADAGIRIAPDLMTAQPDIPERLQEGIASNGEAANVGTAVPEGAIAPERSPYDPAIAPERAIAPETAPASERPYLPSQPTEQPREVVPLTVEHDLSGLDRQAFRVLPSDDSGAAAVVVPAQDSPPTPAPAKGNDALPSLSSRDLKHGARSRLRNLPSLSLDTTGNIPAQQATLDVEPVAKEDIFSDGGSVVSSTGAFVPLGTTGVMRPVGADLLEYHDDKEIYVHDADDTSIAEHYSQSGEYTEPELVQIPNSRMKSFLGSVGDRLTGKKKEKLEDLPSSWLGVDERYDARKEGNEIGSWDNFHGEKDSENDNWKGGAYGGGSYEDNVDAMMSGSMALLDKEVWLVALGANESKNIGLSELYANHGNELKNALFINLCGVGAGDLVFTISEGSFRPIPTDHRMQNLVSTAAQDMAIPIGPVSFKVFNTDATEALKRGGRAISIMGLGDQVPVGWRWTNDEVPRLREDNMVDVVNLVLEIIKNS